MADITNIDQIAEENDRLTESYINDVNSTFKQNEQKLALTDETISSLRDEIEDKQRQIDELFLILNDINLEGLATIEYANSRAWNLVASATKTNTFDIPTDNEYYRIPFERITGEGFDTSGRFSVSESGNYIVMLQIRVDTLATASTPDLSAKVSVFTDNQEAPLPIHQSESARGDLVFTGQNAIPFALIQGSIIDTRVYLTIGQLCRVRERSSISIWKLPEF